MDIKKLLKSIFKVLSWSLGFAGIVVGIALGTIHAPMIFIGVCIFVLLVWLIYIDYTEGL